MTGVHSGMDINWFRRRLIETRAELEAADAVSEAARSTVALDQTSVGRVSRVDALQAQQMALATQRRRAVHLQRIAAALRRIEAGEFGDCVACAEPIAERRLQVDPSVPDCIECASKRG